MRWLKVLCYCAAIRDEGQSDATLAAITVTRGLGEGKDRANEFDRLLEKERVLCVPTPEDKFTHEMKAFYMA
jgi:hypothetical protein